MTTQQTAPTGRHVVVGVDGSEPSKQALRWAQFLAQATASTIEAVAVWQPYIAYGGGWATVPADWNPAQDAETNLTATIEAVFGQHRPAGLELTVREGTAARVLLDASQGAQMLIVGSRGHGGFTGLLLGSVSATCAEHATCPVLVIHGDTPAPATPASTGPTGTPQPGPILD